MATCSHILAWKIPWTEEPGRLRPWGHKESERTEHADKSKELQGWRKNWLVGLTEGQYYIVLMDEFRTPKGVFESI